MIDFINRFKIPTILGLSIIFIGLASGLYLVLREQTLLSQAAPNVTAQNITFTNSTEDSVVISWQTNSETASFVTFGQNTSTEQTVFDDRDTSLPKPRLTHYVTLKNLLPQTRYQFKIVSGKIASGIKSFETAKPAANQTVLAPIIGSVLNDKASLDDGIVYLSIAGAATQSALIKSGGNFLIPLLYIRKTDLSDVYPLTDDMIAKLSIISDQGSANVGFKLTTSSTPLAPIKLGQNLDLIDKEATPQAELVVKIPDKYDLNSDGKINAADYSLLSSCFGKKSNTALKGNLSTGQAGLPCIKADINGDGVINKKDLDLITKKFKELGLEPQ